MSFKERPGKAVWIVAAAVIIAAAATAAVVAPVGAVVAAAAAEQQNQDDDPPAVAATKTVITTHNLYLQEISLRPGPYIPCYSDGIKRCGVCLTFPGPFFKFVYKIIYAFSSECVIMSKIGWCSLLLAARNMKEHTYGTFF